MKTLLLIVVLVICNWSFSQNTFQFIDKTNNEPIAFVKVLPSIGEPLITDIDGYFQINHHDELKIQIRAFGYRDTTIALLPQNTKISLTPNYSSLDEVVINPGINPAHRIIEQVIENKKYNNPNNQGTYQYESYGKFFLTANPDAISNISDTIKDTSLLSMKKFFTNQHIFMMENSTDKFFSPPNSTKEIVNSYKVSGFNNPIFSTFINEMQSFNFYENQFEIAGKNYINPIAFGSTKRYLFIIEDTTYKNNDTIYTISFRPRKGKNFDGLKGYLYINTNKYAIEKVISEPYDQDANMPIKVIQEFEHIDNKHWFPTKLSSEITLKSIKLDDKNDESYLIGKGSTYIKNVVFGNEMKRSLFNDDITIETAVDANEKTEKDWEKTRIYELTDQEKRTYTFLDSVSSVENFERKLNILTSLINQKLPLGKYIDLNLNRLINFNLYEGLRFGAGLQTSENISKRITVGGYFGWGTKDKQWKYGGFSEIKLYPKRDLKLRLEYHHDLITRGSYNSILKSNTFNVNALLSDFYAQMMDEETSAKASLQGYLVKSVKIGTYIDYKHVSFTQGYKFNGQIDKMRIGEIGAEISYSFGEKFRQIGYNRISMGSKFPRITASITKGLENLFDSELSYTRANISINHQIKLLTYGKINWSIDASQVNGKVPLYLLNRATGTGKDWWLSVPNSFETVLPSEFFNNRQLNVFFRYSTPKVNLKIIKPIFSVHHAMGIGELFENNTSHSHEFKSMNKGLYETGIIIDNLLDLKTYALGIGIFNRYGYYSNPQFDKNLVYKISLSINL